MYGNISESEMKPATMGLTWVSSPQIQGLISDRVTGQEGEGFLKLLGNTSQAAMKHLTVMGVKSLKHI